MALAARMKCISEMPDKLNCRMCPGIDQDEDKETLFSSVCVRLWSGILPQAACSGVNTI